MALPRLHQAEASPWRERRQASHLQEARVGRQDLQKRIGDDLLVEFHHTQPIIIPTVIIRSKYRDRKMLYCLAGRLLERRYATAGSDILSVDIVRA